MPFLKNKKSVAVILGTFSLVVFVILTLWTPFQLWQNTLADYLYKPGQPRKDIILVTIDEDAVNPASGLGRFELWNRDYYAIVLKNLNKYQPKVVAFDIFFKNQRSSEGDKQFTDALRTTPSSVLASANVEGKLSDKGFFSTFAVNDLPYKPFIEPQNVALGVSRVINDPDQVIRRIIPGIYDESRNTYNEAFSFMIIRKFFHGITPVGLPNISLSQYRMKLSDTKEINIPLENGQMLINYSSSPHNGRAVYTSVPFKQVYNDKYLVFNPQNFKDKIVLIGATAGVINDNYFTPLDTRYRMPGVEIHANAIQTILDQKFLRNESFVEKIMVLFVLCLAGAFVFMYSKIRWSVFFLVFILGVYTLSAPFAFSYGVILDLVHPYLALPAVFVASYMYRYLTEFKEKNILRSAFGKYVNPGVIAEIMAHPEQLKLGGEKRDITVLFTDIAHFTSIAEKLKPESLVALLNEYFGVMSEIILSEGGTLDKFEGDAVMAFFGAPLPQSDHALRACRTAIKMRYRLHELLQKWEADPPLPGGEKKPSFDFRCGVSSGEVIVGNMGSSERLEYTVMGDIVNLGSRLEGANKKYGTHVMVSEATYQTVQDFFEARELDIIRVVGKTQPIRIYELLAMKGDLPENAMQLLHWYYEGMELYHQRKFTEALTKFEDILKVYSGDGPSQLYRQRCEVLKDFPPKADWDEVFEMGSK